MSVAAQADYSAVYQYIADAMAAGSQDQQIVEALASQGWDRTMAVQMVADTRLQMNRFSDPAPTSASPVDYARPQKYVAEPDHGGDSTAMRDIAVGGLFCVIGIVVTVASYSSASGGGRYVVAWGAILFGGIQFFKGLINAASGK